MNFYLGCAVWSYKDWVGNFYPAKSKTGDFLRLYSERLPTVEGNTTFYAFQKSATLVRWREQTPDYFRFCLKFPQEITHQGLLAPKIDQAINFILPMKQLQQPM